MHHQSQSRKSSARAEAALEVAEQQRAIPAANSAASVVPATSAQKEQLELRIKLQLLQEEKDQTQAALAAAEAKLAVHKGVPDVPPWLFWGDFRGMPTANAEG